MIQQPDVEQRGRLRDPFGQHLVLRTGFGGAGGVGVNQDKLCGKQFQSPFDNQPVIDDRALHAALTYPLAFDDPLVLRADLAFASQSGCVETTLMSRPITSTPDRLQTSGPSSCRTKPSGRIPTVTS